MIRKLAGGKQLDCGHQQVLPAYRLKLSAAGMEQSPVWCVDCEGWVRFAPNQASVEEAEAEEQWEARFSFMASPPPAPEERGVPLGEKPQPQENEEGKE